MVVDGRGKCKMMVIVEEEEEMVEEEKGNRN